MITYYYQNEHRNVNLRYGQLCHYGDLTVTWQPIRTQNSRSLWWGNCLLQNTIVLLNMTALSHSLPLLWRTVPDSVWLETRYLFNVRPDRSVSFCWNKGWEYSSGISVFMSHVYTLKDVFCLLSNTLIKQHTQLPDSSWTMTHGSTWEDHEKILRYQQPLC